MSLGRAERFTAEEKPPLVEGQLELPPSTTSPVAAPPGVIHCCICLNQRKERLPATTIVKGYAVCDNHIELVGQVGFSIFKLGPGQRST